MAKTWRERTADAERVGVFSTEDRDEWKSPTRCCVGEHAWGVAEALGVSFDRAWMLLNGSDEFSSAAFDAISHNEPHHLSRVLDAIEARALQLKREGVA